MNKKGTSGRLAGWGIGIAALVIPLTTVVSHSFSRVTYPQVLPAIKDDLGLSNTVVGWAGTAIFVAYLLGVVTITVLSGRLNPATVMKVGLGVSVAGLALIASGPSFGVITFGLVIANFATAAIWMTAPVLATRDVAFNRRGLVVGLLTGSMGLANSIIALGIGVSRSATGNNELWRPVFGVEAVVAVGVLLLVLATIAKRPTAVRAGRSFALTALKTMPGWLPLTIAYTGFGAITSGFSTFLAEALESDGGIARPTVATVYLFLGVSGFAGALLMGWLSDRIGRPGAMIVVALTNAVASISVVVLQGPALIACVIAFGGMWSAFPSLTAVYVRDHLDDQAFGSAFGVMTIFYGLAAVPPPLLIGVISDARGSFAIAYVALTVLSLTAAAVLTRLPRP